MHTAVVPNQIVLVRNNNRNKFDQVLGPVLHKVVDVIGNEVTLHRQSGGQILHRHLDDAKLFHRGHEDMCWVESGLCYPHCPPARFRDEEGVME